MSKVEKKQSNWRSNASYISTAISISMVLYVMGLMGFIFLKAKTLSDQSKENFRFEIYIKDGVKDNEIMQFKKQLEAKSFVKKTVYKDKEEALKEFKEAINPEEDFTMILGRNPLPQNLDVYFIANYTHPDSVKLFKKSIANHPIISDFRYPSDLLFLVHKNVDRISFALLIVCVLLLFVAMGLINNTIRLRVYAQRFLIRTMQLIGASHSFIRRPFLYRAIALGFISGCLAVIAMAGSLHLLYASWPEAALELINFQQDVQLYAFMIVIGIIITWGSTLLAVRRFLKLKTEKLYY